MPQAELWIAGVVLMIVGCVGSNLGNNLMSLGLAKLAQPRFYNDELAVVLDSTPRSYETKYRWIYNIGVVLFVAGALMSIAAYAFGAQSVIAALESTQFVSNVFFAYFIHEQPITLSQLLATGVIVGGNLLIVLFSIRRTYMLTAHQISEIYIQNAPYQIYLAISGFSCFVFFAISQWYLYSQRQKIPNSKMIASSNNNNYQSSGDASGTVHHGLVESLSYALYSAILGTQTVLQAKIIAMLIEISIAGENQLIYPATYIFFLLLLVFAYFWVNRLNRGLQLFSPIFIIPTLQVFFLLFASLSGGIFFSEFDSFTTQQTIGYVFGITMILVGVFFLIPWEY